MGKLIIINPLKMNAYHTSIIKSEGRITIPIVDYGLFSDIIRIEISGEEGRLQFHQVLEDGATYVYLKNTWNDPTPWTIETIGLQTLYENKQGFRGTALFLVEKDAWYI